MTPTAFEPQGVIPACLLPFHADLSIDERDKAALQEHFTPEQIVELGILCGLCLGYGRFSAVNGLSDDVACAVPASE